MRKQLFKCATVFLLTASLLLSTLPLFAGAKESGDPQQIERPVNTAEEIGIGITPTPITPPPEEETEIRAVDGVQSDNQSPSSPYYTRETIYEDPDDPFAEIYEYLGSNTTTIPDGVYSIESLAYEMLGMYNLYSLYEPYSDDFVVQLWDYQGITPVECYDQFGSFKITKKPNTNYYVIRWMSNNRYGITGAGGSLSLKALPYNDADVLLADTFSITYNGGGFIIKPYGSTTAISIPATADPYDGPELALENPTSAGTRARWNLIRYTGPDYHGFRMEGDTAGLRDGLYAGETLSLKIFGFSTDPYTNEVTATSSSGTSLATISWSSSTQTLTLTAHKPASFSFFYIQTVNDTNEISCRFRRAFSLYLPFPEGLYCIQNQETFLLGGHYYLEVQNSTPNSQIVLHENRPSDKIRWQITHDTDGYYKLTSYESGLVLTAPPASSLNLLDEELTQSEDTQDDSQRFKIELLANGNYVIRPKSREGDFTNWCVAMGAGLGTRDAVLSAYTNNSMDDDEWRFLPCDTYAHTYVGDYIGDPNMPSVLFSAESKFLSHSLAGYGNLSVPEDVFFQQLQKVEIATMFMHGNQQGLALNSSLTPTNSTVANAPYIDITISDVKSKRLGNLKLVCLGGCETGRDGIAGEVEEITAENANNITEAFFVAGADIAIGFTGTIYQDELSVWLPIFLGYLLNGHSISEAKISANAKLVEYCSTPQGGNCTPSITESTCYVLGDQTTVLYPN